MIMTPTRTFYMLNDGHHDNDTNKEMFDEVDNKNFQAERWKKAFPFRKQTAYITVPRATALACDSATLRNTFSREVDKVSNCNRTTLVNPQKMLSSESSCSYIGTLGNTKS